MILPETLDGYPVSEIGMGAFSYPDSLRSVVIPDRVTAIADSAFASCANLTAVAFPESLTGIGSFAFYNCGKEGIRSAPGCLNRRTGERMA